jgi:(1->4)-alpha-D-glucan 1-alpha-D-glucosylmutase
LPVGLERRGGWGDTTLDIGGPATDVITGRPVPRDAALGEVFDTYPVALLVR